MSNPKHDRQLKLQQATEDTRGTKEQLSRQQAHERLQQDGLPVLNGHVQKTFNPDKNGVMQEVNPDSDNKNEQTKPNSTIKNNLDTNKNKYPEAQAVHDADGKPTHIDFTPGTHRK